MSVMRAIKVKETCKEWFKTVIKSTLPSSRLKPLSTEYVNDMYRGIRSNNCSRDERRHLRHECTCNVYRFSITSKISNISLVYL